MVEADVPPVILRAILMTLQAISGRGIFAALSSTLQERESAASALRSGTLSPSAQQAENALKVRLRSVGSLPQMARYDQAQFRLDCANNEEWIRLQLWNEKGHPHAEKIVVGSPVRPSIGLTQELLCECQVRVRENALEIVRLDVRTSPPDTEERLRLDTRFGQMVAATFAYLLRHSQRPRFLWPHKLRITASDANRHLSVSIAPLESDGTVLPKNHRGYRLTSDFQVCDVVPGA